MIENKLALLAIPLLPLLGAILAGFFGRLGRAFAHSATIFCVTAAFALSCFVFQDVQAGKTFNADIYTWLNAGGIKLAVGFLIDPLTATMMLVVTFVSLMVHI
ncbi:MAG: NADH-quinone oxidoreductase subunit L, partial [Betaproteobacteria bacterium]|nr:NADH-quinone oxidoreductase subunit L [Betaproteobacteria bacterium]